MRQADVLDAVFEEGLRCEDAGHLRQGRVADRMFDDGDIFVVDGAVAQAVEVFSCRWLGNNSGWGGSLCRG